MEYCTANENFISNGVIVYTPTLPNPPAKAITGVEDSNELFEKLEKAIEQIESKNYSDARNICLELVENYPDSSISFNALGLLKKTFGSQENDAIDIYNSIFKKGDKNINAIAGLILANIDVKNKEKIIDEVLNKFNGKEIYESALHQKFLYYLNDNTDFERARKVLNEIDKLFPKSISSYDAHRQLGDKEYLNMPFEEIIQNIQHSYQADYLNNKKEFTVENYPNPFNPTTTIKYTLPFDGRVIVKVFDIMGREVSTLINQINQAGTYNVTWDSKDNYGNEVSSGIYFYNIRFGDKSVFKEDVDGEVILSLQQKSRFYRGILVR